MEYLIEQDKAKVKECFGYYYISGKDYKEWFLSPSLSKKDKTNHIDDEEFFKVYEFSLADKYYSKIEKTLLPYYGSLTYVVVHEDDDNVDKHKLCYTEYNTSSPFALFLSSIDFNFLSETENEE